MRIQHNISALNAHRQLGTNNTAVSKNLEKLSSGYRINRAGDDAAGLAISEKMRGQIRGLDQAQANAQDGISLIQTAEGGLNETHSILQRMRELAVQSSNGTYKNEVDRENINKEMNSLKSEIDRIATSTHFNKINLLDGNLGKAGGAASGGVSSGRTIANIELSENLSSALTVNGATAGSWTAAAAPTAVTAGTSNKYTFAYKDENGNAKSIDIELSLDVNNVASAKVNGKTVDIDPASDFGNDQVLIGTTLKSLLEKTDFAKSFTIADNGFVNSGGAGNEDGVLIFTAKTKGLGGASMQFVKEALDPVNTPDDTAALALVETAAADKSYTLDVTGLTAWNKDVDAKDSVITIDGQKYAFVETGKLSDAKKALGSDVQLIETANAGAGALDAADTAALAALINAKSGDGTVSANTTNLTFTSREGTGTGASGAGLTFQIGANGSADQRVTLYVEDMSSAGIGVKDVSVADQDLANAAIDSIDDAINLVSGTRADLGALQNRLEHTVANLGTTSENLTAAESRIRDVDMAKEMMEMTKNNILTQAAQAMLAQANTQPQGVLQLLR